MAHYVGPKNRLSRREGFDLFGRGNKLRRATIPPGVHGQKTRRRPSSFGIQLREKQKTKRIYGIMERQFRKYFEIARKVKGATGNVLLQLLESRLDNTVYRLGFAPTRNLARQLVSHNHVLVGDRLVNVPSYQIRPGDTITLKPKAQTIPAVKARLDNTDLPIPVWLSRQGAVGQVVSLPTRDQIDTPANDQLIVEYYSNR